MYYIYSESRPLAISCLLQRSPEAAVPTSTTTPPLPQPSSSRFSLHGACSYLSRQRGHLVDRSLRGWVTTTSSSRRSVSRPLKVSFWAHGLSAFFVANLCDCSVMNAFSPGVVGGSSDRPRSASPVRNLTLFWNELNRCQRRLPSTRICSSTGVSCPTGLSFSTGVYSSTGVSSCWLPASAGLCSSGRCSVQPAPAGSAETGKWQCC